MKRLQPFKRLKLKRASLALQLKKDSSNSLFVSLNWKRIFTVPINFKVQSISSRA